MKEVVTSNWHLLICGDGRKRKWDLPRERCDQIWRNFATVIKCQKFLALFEGSFSFCAKFFSYFGNHFILLGKFSLLQMAKKFKN